MAEWGIDFASRKHTWQYYASLTCFVLEWVIFLYCVLTALFAMGKASVLVGAACVGILILAFAGAYIAYSGLKRKERIYRTGLKVGLLLNLAVMAGVVALYLWGSNYVQI